MLGCCDGGGDPGPLTYVYGEAFGVLQVAEYLVGRQSDALVHAGPTLASASAGRHVGSTAPLCMSMLMRGRGLASVYDACCMPAIFPLSSTLGLNPFHAGPPPLLLPNNLGNNLIYISIIFFYNFLT